MLAYAVTPSCDNTWQYGAPGISTITFVPALNVPSGGVSLSGFFA